MVEASLGLEDFKGVIGTVFTVREDGFPALDLMLEAVDPLPARHVSHETRPPFSLIFLGAHDGVLPQQLYRLRHETLGETAIFLVPIGQDARGVSYQAVFN